MKALVLEEKNKHPRYCEYKNPQIGEGEILVQLKAAALNHRDVWITKGLYPGINPPVILGSDGAGLVDKKEVIINPSINWGEKSTAPGKDYHILGLPTNGTFAEYLAVNKKQIYPKPAHLTWEEAAALPLSGLTAYRAIFTKGQLKKGDNVLISGVGGGVALFAFQLALAAEANVFITSGKEEKIEQAIKMGAKGGVNYKTEDWDKSLQKLAGGFDLIIDSAAGKGFSKLVKCCNFGARIVIYGGTRGDISVLSPQLIFWKQISIHGTSMGNDAEFLAMLEFMNKHKIKPVIDSVYSLKNSDVAFERIQAGLQFGKVVFSI